MVKGEGSSAPEGGSHSPPAPPAARSARRAFGRGGAHERGIPRAPREGRGETRAWQSQAVKEVKDKDPRGAPAPTAPGSPIQAFMGTRRTGNPLTRGIYPDPLPRSTWTDAPIPGYGAPAIERRYPISSSGADGLSVARPATQWVTTRRRWPWAVVKRAGDPHDRGHAGLEEGSRREGPISMTITTAAICSPKLCRRPRARR